MKMPGKEDNAHRGFFCYCSANNDLAASTLDFDRVAVSNAVNLRVSRVNFNARFGVGIVQHGIASYRAAMPMFQQSAGRENERIFIVGLFAHRDIFQGMEFPATAREGFCK